MRERRADHAGFAMVQGRHRVEEVGEAARATCKRFDAVFVAAQRVADLHLVAAGDEHFDCFHVARHFGCHGDEADGRHVVEPLHFVGAEGPREVGLRTELAGVDVRAFEVNAEHARCVARAAGAHGPQAREGGLQVADGRGHRRREQRGRAVSRMESCDLGGSVAAFHDVVPAAAMNVQVDEARQHQGLGGFARLLGLDRCPLDARDAAVCRELDRA